MPWFGKSKPSLGDAIKAMREKFPDSPDAEIMRFLNARDLDIDAAAEMLTKHLTWRRVGLSSHNQWQRRARWGDGGAQQPSVPTQQRLCMRVCAATKSNLSADLPCMLFTE